MKNGYYYIGYGWDSDCDIEIEHPYRNYEEALKEAIKSHKYEIEYQRSIGNKTGEVMNTYVILYGYDNYKYEMACITGRRCKVIEYEYK